MTKLPLKIALLLSGITGLVVASLMFFMKSEGSSTSLLGLSSSKIALIILTVITSLLLLWLSFRWGQEQDKVHILLENAFQKFKSVWIFVLFWTFILMFILQQESLFVYLMRPIKTIDTEMFYLRIAPLMVWLALVCIYLSVGIFMINLAALGEIKTQEQLNYVVFLLFLVRVIDPQRKSGFWQGATNLFKQYRLGVLIWFFILLLWVFIWKTGIGLVPDDRFWNIAGVPFLPMQIIGAALLVIFLLDIRSLLPEKLATRLSAPGSIILVAVGIWALSVAIWQREPLYHTYFSPGPYLPNEAHYPFSDAMRFDIGSQYLIMGRGISNDGFTERPFLYVFLGLIHLIAGQDYDRVMFVQILFLALIPVFMFLIGRQLHSPITGIILGVLGIFSGKNAIAAANTAGIINPKVMMSELPTTLFLLIFAFCVIRWFQENKTIWAVLAGGAIGLGIGFRGNVLVVVPILLAIIILHYFVNKLSAKDLLIKVSFFTLALFVVVAPYSIKTLNSFGQVFFLPKIRTVIERASYEWQDVTPAKLHKTVPVKYDETKVLADALRKPSDSPGALQLPEELIDYTFRHFIHNQIMAVLIFPLDYKTLDLNEITNKPFWDGENLWEGALTPGEIVLLSSNLLIISLGLGYAIKTWRVTGAVPIMIHLGYQFANGLARTSGGRYLAPTNWVLTLYFFLGFAALIYSIRQLSRPSAPGKLPDTTQPTRFGLVTFSLVLLLGIGASFMFFNSITPEYSLVSSSQAKQMLREIDWSEYEISDGMVTNINDLVASEEGFVRMGFALYPRYYKSGEQNPVSSYLPRMETESSRIYFVLLTENGPVTVNLIWGDQKLKTFPHAEYGLLVGLPKTGYVEGYAFIPISTNDQEVFFAEPSLWD